MFTLKNVSVYEPGSHETLCFNATVLLDGEEIAYVENDGWGGPNNYRQLNGVYFDFPEGGENDMEVMSLVDEWMMCKKYQTKGLVLRKGDDYCTVKFPLPITKFKKHPQYQKWIDGWKSKKEYAVLNRNL